MMAERTNHEIVDKMNAVQSGGSDWMGTQRGELVSYLPFSAAREFLKPDVDEADWKQYPRDADSIVREIYKYMPFAWGLKSWF